MRDPIQDLVDFVQWLRDTQGSDFFRLITEEQLRKKADEWYEKQHGDEHG